MSTLWEQAEALRLANPGKRVVVGPGGALSLQDIGPTLPEAKVARIQADREACAARLIEHYGSAEEQVSRSLGVYGVQARDNMLAGIQACIDASNTARDLINAATTVAQVEAVTVAWPVLT